MKKTITFNSNPQDSKSIKWEVVKEFTNHSYILAYIDDCIKYRNFCNNQTKTGQARKNERSRKRKATFTNHSESVIRLANQLKTRLEQVRASQLPKTSIQIEYDGRKRNNLRKIIEHVKMLQNICGSGEPSQQAIGDGLISYKLV